MFKQKGQWDILKWDGYLLNIVLNVFCKNYISSTVNMQTGISSCTNIPARNGKHKFIQYNMATNGYGIEALYIAACT